jgi:hypothetical protein
MICALRRTRNGWEELRRLAESREAGWSALGHSFLQYDREVFIEALCDWAGVAMEHRLRGIGAQISRRMSPRRRTDDLDGRRSDPMGCVPKQFAIC